jgi:hypothetical protein
LIRGVLRVRPSLTPNTSHALVAWAEKNKPAIAESQKRFDEVPEPLQVAGRGVVYRQL